MSISKVAAFRLGNNLDLHGSLSNTGIKFGRWFQTSNYPPEIQEEARKYDWDCSLQEAMVKARCMICDVLKRETQGPAAPSYEKVLEQLAKFENLYSMDSEQMRLLYNRRKLKESEDMDEWYRLLLLTDRKPKDS